MSMSDSIHPLRTFLQLHLASDDAAILNLPFVIQFLSPQHLQPSPHLQKWITRINSLIHSKDQGARWAGLSIACQIALFSRALMLKNARNWVGATLPLFSVRPSIYALVPWLSSCEEKRRACSNFESCHATPHLYFLCRNRYS